MDKDTLAIVGAVTFCLLWVFWRVGWQFENMARWDSLPLWERLMGVVIMVSWFGLVEFVAWYSGK